MVASPDIIEQVISTYERAAESCRNCTVKDGNTVRVAPPECSELMVTADLHGDRINFHKLCEVADLAHQSGRHLVMQEVCHGGPLYPSSEGCMSHLLLEDVARMKVEFPDRFHFLPGNHELAEMTDFPIVKSNRMLNLLFRTGMQEIYGDESERVRDAFVSFLGECPLAVRLSNGVFISHTLPERVDVDGFDDSVFHRPIAASDLESGGDVFRLLWGRDYRPENAEAFARLVEAEILIHGHEPCSDGFLAPNDWQIILDCCGQRACYVILPVGEKLSHQQIVDRIERLN